MIAFKDFFWILLFPLALVWTFLVQLRRRFFSENWKYRSRIPILCVGNIHSGGSGKTPLVSSIAEHFKERNPVVLARGYKSLSSKSGAKISDEGGPDLYGDEPWMLRKKLKAPVYVGKNRVSLVQEIEKKEKTSLILMDDGFQHFYLSRTVDLVAIHGIHKLSESNCLPLGYLREPLSALRFATAIVLFEGSEEWRDFLKKNFSQVPVFQPERKNFELWDGQKTVFFEKTQRIGGFCGIAQPGRFESDLGNLGFLSFFKSFPDHHAYTAIQIDSLFKAAKSENVEYLITTEKDWHKVLPFTLRESPTLLMFRIEYEFSDEFWYFLERRLETNSKLFSS